MKKRKLIVATALAFEVTLNLNGCGMYGPEPSEFEENQDTDNVSFTIEYNPQDNIEPDEYGPPPEDYITNQSISDISVTTEFNPKDNEVQLEYGPPLIDNNEIQ